MADQFLRRKRSRRTEALLCSLLMPLAVGLYCLGYVMGARAEHPNSITANVLGVVVCWLLWLLALLWLAAGHEASDER